MQRARALTLIELLIATAMLAILAAILVSALSRAHERARAVNCLTNLRQWGTATHYFTMDHNDFLPPDGAPNPDDSDTNSGWYIQLPETLNLPRYHDMPWRKDPKAAPGRSVWICPTNKRRSNGNNLFHYCLNEHVNGTGANNRPVQISTLKRPAQIVWLFDSKNLPAVGPENYVHTNLHLQGAQFVLLDGHAARFRNTAYWDFAARRGRTNNPSLVWNP